MSNSPNPNHPRKGASIKVEPIRSLEAIASIKSLLANHPRDYCLFTLGINTAYRANELLSLDVEQVRGLRIGDALEIKQSKTGHYRAVPLNPAAHAAIEQWLDCYPVTKGERPLFLSRCGNSLTVPTISRMVKDWCKQVHLCGNYGSHSLRKTWGYHQRVSMGTPIPILMEAFGHASQKQTLDYLGIQSDEIRDIYLKMEL